MFCIAMVFAAEWIGGGTRNPEVLIRMGAIIPGIFERGDWWRLVTVMFLHNGVMHLALNLWALYQLGSIFETLFGSVRFLFTYVLSGLVASVASAALARGVSVGASGAIFGVLGALIFSIRRSPRWRHQPWTRGFIMQLLFWAGMNILIEFGPVTGLLTRPDNTRQKQAEGLVTLIDPLLWPIEQRSLVPLPVKTPAPATAAASPPAVASPAP